MTDLLKPLEPLIVHLLNSNMICEGYYADRQVKHLAPIFASICFKSHSDLMKAETYHVLLMAYAVDRDPERRVSVFHYMRIGDTLLSTGLITVGTVFLACEGFITKRMITPSRLYYPWQSLMHFLYHSKEGRVVAQEVATSLLKHKPTSTSPSLVDEAITALTSREATAIVNVITIATPLIGTLLLVAKRWSKKQGTGSASSQSGPLQPPESEIVAIRLLMNHGPEEKIPSEWLTDPEKLKHWINVLNDPSSAVKPLQAIFVMRNGTKVFVDVSEDAQSSLQLNELLSILNIDAPEK